MHNFWINTFNLFWNYKIFIFQSIAALKLLHWIWYLHISRGLIITGENYKKWFIVFLTICIKVYSSNDKTNSSVTLDRTSTRKIIEAASNPKSIREISTECGMSLSTGYRRVYELCDCKLLEVHSSTIRLGRRCLLFKAKNWIQRDRALL